MHYSKLPGGVREDQGASLSVAEAQTLKRDRGPGIDNRGAIAGFSFRSLPWLSGFFRLAGHSLGHRHVVPNCLRGTDSWLALSSGGLNSYRPTITTQFSDPVCLEVSLGVVDNVREAVRLAKQIDNLPLQRTLLELQGEVNELTQRQCDLERERDRLKEALSFSEKLEYRNDAYWPETLGRTVLTAGTWNRRLPACIAMGLTSCL